MEFHTQLEPIAPCPSEIDRFILLQGRKNRNKPVWREREREGEKTRFLTRGTMSVCNYAPNGKPWMMYVDCIGYVLGLRTYEDGERERDEVGEKDGAGFTDLLAVPTYCVLCTYSRS